LLLPIGAYAASYGVLASYHQRAWLLSTVVHESGRLTLAECVLDTPHFLGHVPVIVTLGLAFAAGWRALAPPPERPASGQGGSWNLHLPSTLTQFVAIPLHVLVVRHLLGYPVRPSGSGARIAAASAILFVAMNLVVNAREPATITAAWTSPRYLAHSVRELATFPITYYPLPLWLLLRGEARTDARPPLDRRIVRAALLAGALLPPAIALQTWIPLSVGIDELAQKPSFAHSGRLGIAYLLASHFFEHFLDTLLFTLTCLLAVGARRGSARHSFANGPARSSHGCA